MVKRSREMPGFIRPQLAILRATAATGNYLHEIKYDGYRVQVHITPVGVFPFASCFNVLRSAVDQGSRERRLYWGFAFRGPFLPIGELGRSKLLLPSLFSSKIHEQSK